MNKKIQYKEQATDMNTTPSAASSPIQIYEPDKRSENNALHNSVLLEAESDYVGTPLIKPHWKVEMKKHKPTNIIDINNIPQSQLVTT